MKLFTKRLPRWLQVTADVFKRRVHIKGSLSHREPDVHRTFGQGHVSQLDPPGPGPASVRDQAERSIKSRKLKD